MLISTCYDVGFLYNLALSSPTAEDPPLKRIGIRVDSAAIPYGSRQCFSLDGTTIRQSGGCASG